MDLMERFHTETASNNGPDTFSHPFPLKKITTIQFVSFQILWKKIENPQTDSFASKYLFLDESVAFY
jgi:hypothetical protein